MAYYSSKSPKIYHNCKNCHVGNNMVAGNLIKRKPPIVKGHKKPRLCEVCATLKAMGRRVPGIPKLPMMRPGAKVKTYYSKDYPEIVHICQNCHLGQNIERGQQRKDKPKPFMWRDGKIKKPRLCKNCARLCLAKEGNTGVPIPAGGRVPKLPVSQPKTEVSKARLIVSKPKIRTPELVKAGK